LRQCGLRLRPRQRRLLPRRRRALRRGFGGCGGVRLTRLGGGLGSGLGGGFGAVGGDGGSLGGRLVDHRLHAEQQLRQGERRGGGVVDGEGEVR
jgi:hypothetical protein